MLGDVFWVLVVIAFWAGVFALVFTLVRWAAGSLDAYEVLCSLPEPVTSSL